MILKCDRFLTGEKKAGLQTHFFLIVKQILKALVQLKLVISILLMF